MSELFGMGDMKAQSEKDARSRKGSALATLLAQQAALDKENGAGASTRRPRGRRLLQSLTDDAGSATLG